MIKITKTVTKKTITNKIVDGNKTEVIEETVTTDSHDATPEEIEEINKQKEIMKNVHNGLTSVFESFDKMVSEYFGRMKL